MAATKKVLTKGQLVSHFAEKFCLTKKVAAEVVDEMASLAVAETKKKGSFVLPGIGKWHCLRGKPGREEILRPGKRSRFLPRLL